MTPEALTRAIKQAARELGFDPVGVARANRVGEADLLEQWLNRGYHGTMAWMENHRRKRVDPRALMPGCRSIVCVGLGYYHGDRGPQPDGVGVARYAWGEDYHRVLKDRLFALLERCRAIDPSIEGRAFTDSAPVMDKYWAQRAGLGWRGKNTNLINVRAGSYLFLGELLLTAELVADEPGTDHCGTCTRCLDACPTDAFVAPYVLDARRCIAYWTIEHRGDLEPASEDALDGWVFGCDICQSVCPWNREPPAGAEAFAPGRAAWPDTVDALLTMSEQEFEERFGATAVERTGRRGLVRNIAIAAGEPATGSGVALARAAADPDPVVAAAAQRSQRRRRQVRPDQSPC